MRQLAAAHLGEVRATLRVPQLAHVVLPARARALAPPEEDVGGTLRDALSGDDASSMMIECGSADVRLEDRSLCLLHLQDHVIVLAAGRAFEQADPHPGPDAPHADHLAGDVDDVEPVEQFPAVVSQGRPVGLEHRLDLVHVVFGPVEMDDQRWVLDELMVTAGARASAWPPRRAGRASGPSSCRASRVVGTAPESAR